MPKFITSSLILFLIASFAGLFYFQSSHYDILSLTTVSIAFTALFAMSWALLLAAKLPLVEYLFGGADRAYQAHRYLGYGAVIGFLLHWNLGFEAVRGLVETDFSEFAEGIGVIPAILITALGVISALKLIPYHIWKYSHFAMGPLYAVAVFHSNFTPNPMLNTPMEPILWVISGVGIFGWLMTLLNHLNRGKKYKLVGLKHNSNSIDLHLVPTGRGIKSKAGQFADIKFMSLEHKEFHPFTIAGTNQDELRFIIAKLGDHTNKIYENLQIGDEIRVKSARGNFMPLRKKAQKKPQIWVAAGVGITPFLASLNALNDGSENHINLHYLVKSKEHAIAYEELMRHQQRLPNFKLTLYPRDQVERVNEAGFNQIFSAVGKNAQLYMCAPECLKKTMRSVWKKRHSKANMFEEKFDFRAAI